MVCPGFDAADYDLYALGVLEEPEAGEVRSHIRLDCETCRAAVQSSLLRVSELAYFAPPVSPPRGLRRRVTRLVKPAPSQWSLFGLPALGLAGIAVLTITIGSVAAGRFLSEYRTAQEQVTIVSRLSPPPVPRIESAAPSTAPAAVDDARLMAAQRELAATQSQASASAQELDRQRAAVARLENDVRTRDQQLASARRDLDTAQARYTAAAQDAGRAQAARAQLASSQARIVELTQEIEIYKASLEQQKRQIDRNVQTVALLNAPGLRLVELKSTEEGHGALGRALVADGKVQFYASQLPALPAGRSYQLWFIRSRGTPIVSAGVFQPDRGRGATLEVNNANLLAGLTAMAVTEEPAGGSPLPTGHKVLVGTATRA